MTTSKTPLLDSTSPLLSSSTIIQNYGAAGVADEEEAGEALLPKVDVKVGKRFSEIWVLCVGLWASIFCSAIGKFALYSLIQSSIAFCPEWRELGREEGRRKVDGCTATLLAASSSLSFLLRYGYALAPASLITTVVWEDLQNPSRHRLYECSKPTLSKSVAYTSPLAPLLSAGTLVTNLQLEIATEFDAGHLASWLGSGYLLGLGSFSPSFPPLSGFEPKLAPPPHLLQRLSRRSMDD